MLKFIVPVLLFVLSGCDNLVGPQADIAADIEKKLHVKVGVEKRDTNGHISVVVTLKELPAGDPTSQRNEIQRIVGQHIANVESVEVIASPKAFREDSVKQSAGQDW